MSYIASYTKTAYTLTIAETTRDDAQKAVCKPIRSARRGIRTLSSFLRMNRLRGQLYTINDCRGILTLTINITKSFTNSAYLYIAMERSNVDLASGNERK